MSLRNYNVQGVSLIDESEDLWKILQNIKILGLPTHKVGYKGSIQST